MFVEYTNEDLSKFLSERIDVTQARDLKESLAAGAQSGGSSRYFFSNG
jgi:hypothetical protein